MAVMTKSARQVTAEDAAALVRSGDWVDYGAVLAQPDAFDTALAARVGELRNVNIRGVSEPATASGARGRSRT